MQAQVDIGYEELVKLLKQLTPTEWHQLKGEMENVSATNNENADMLGMLLNGPTFTEQQLDEIAQARKEINQWRTS